MKDEDIDCAFHDKGKVKIKWRTWDGIDKPEYFNSSGLFPNWARDLARDLLKSADEADVYNKEMKKNSLLLLKKKREDLDQQITELENKKA